MFCSVKAAEQLVNDETDGLFPEEDEDDDVDLQG